MVDPVVPAAPNRAAVIKSYLGIAIVGAMAVWLIAKERYDVGILAIGWILNQLGVGGQNTAILLGTAAAALHAKEATHVAGLANDRASEAATGIREAVQVIQDSPAISGIHKSNS